MLRNFELDFPKVAVLKRLRKAQWLAPFVERPVFSLYQQNIDKNAVVRNSVPSADKIYQWDFPKAMVSKRSTKGAMSSPFRRAPCI